MVSEDPGRRGFVRKLLKVAALGGIAGLLLGQSAERANAQPPWPVYTYDLGVGGTSRVAFWTGPGYAIGSRDVFLWDNVNTRLGIGTSSPERTLHLVGSGPRILIESSDGYASEVNFKHSGDSASRVWALYKHGGTHDLRFYQDGDKVTIQDGTGNVGIGTTNPVTKLHAVGDAYVEGTTSGNVMSVINHYNPYPIISQATGLAASTENVTAILRGAGVQGDAYAGPGVSGESFYGPGVHGSSSTGTGVLATVSTATGKPLVVKANSSGPQTANLQEWQKNDGTPLSSVDKDGNFGIGIASPARQLHIRGNNAVARLDRDVDSASFIFTRTAAGDFNTIWKTFTFGVKATGVDAGSFFIGDMHTNVSGTSDNRILIDTTGKVGIGTTTPSERLHVAGNVKATGFITGDVTFANGVRATEEGKGLAFLNGAGQKIAVLDSEGNFHIRGKFVEDL